MAEDIVTKGLPLWRYLQPEFHPSHELDFLLRNLSSHYIIDQQSAHLTEVLIPHVLSPFFYVLNAVSLIHYSSGFFLL